MFKITPEEDAVQKPFFQLIHEEEADEDEDQEVDEDEDDGDDDLD